MSSHVEVTTTRQRLSVIVIAIVNFCSAICVSLQAPFYPKEAEDKGASAAGYGLVFGIFELTVFLVSPFMGQNLCRIGTKRAFNGGIFTTGTCCVLFGLLDQIQNPNIFIGVSFMVRALEAVGNSAFLTASFSIIASEFPDVVATMFSAMEMCFGMGLIVGPTIGAYLYDLGGYALPFVSLGSILVASAFMTYFIMPDLSTQQQRPSSSCDQDDRKSVTDALKIVPIALASFTIFAASMSIGFLQATLEPHLRQFQLSSIVMGLMFVINGGSYALTAPIFGWICDRKADPKIIGILGNALIVVSFIALGLPILSQIFIVDVGSLVIHGIGIGCCLVSGFADAFKEAVHNGFEDNLSTYGLISGLWTSTFALGAFVGPSLGGLLEAAFGFPFASLLIILFASMGFLFSLIYYCTRHRHRRRIRRQQKNVTETRTSYGSLRDDGGMSSKEFV